jgi:hypothetical protein
LIQIVHDTEVSISIEDPKKWQNQNSFGLGWTKKGISGEVTKLCWEVKGIKIILLKRNFISIYYEVYIEISRVQLPILDYKNVTFFLV